jgi:hypothetical protein
MLYLVDYKCGRDFALFSKNLSIKIHWRMGLKRIACNFQLLLQYTIATMGVWIQHKLGVIDAGI